LGLPVAVLGRGLCWLGVAGCWRCLSGGCSVSWWLWLLRGGFWLVCWGLGGCGLGGGLSLLWLVWLFCCWGLLGAGLGGGAAGGGGC